MHIIIIYIIFTVYNNKMEFEIPVEKKTYYKAALMIINVPLNLNLSNMEMDMISYFLNSGKEYLDSDVKDKMAVELDKDIYSINNYISRLKEKKMLLLKPNSRLLYFNTNIKNIISDNNISFNLKILN